MSMRYMVKMSVANITIPDLSIVKGFCNFYYKIRNKYL